jgi:hypothetical protein
MGEGSVLYILERLRNLEGWPLPVVIFLVWAIWVVTCAMQVAVEDVRRGTPKDRRRGTSFVPSFPLFPLGFWGAALLINRVAPGSGTAAVGGFHVVYGLSMLGYCIWAVRYLRAHESQ